MKIIQLQLTDINDNIDICQVDTYKDMVSINWDEVQYQHEVTGLINDDIADKFIERINNLLVKLGQNETEGGKDAEFICIDQTDDENLDKKIKRGYFDEPLTDLTKHNPHNFYSM